MITDKNGKTVFKGMTSVAGFAGVVRGARRARPDREGGAGRRARTARRRPGGSSAAIHERSAPLTRWLLGRATWHLWAAGLGLMAVTVLELLRTNPHVGMDNEFVARAARAFLDGGAPYADKRFLYLPSAVLVAVPEALLPHDLRVTLVPAVGVVVILTGWLLSLRVFGVPARSRLAALAVVGFAFFAPFRSLVVLGNWTLAAVVAFPLSLLLALRRRWVAAGLVIGAALAIKPMLAPMVLLLVFARRWRAVAAAVGVPVAAGAVAAALMPEPGLFVTRTLPFLLHGQDNFARPFDASLGMVLSRLGLPGVVAYGLGAAAAVSGLVCAWLRWRRGGDEPRRLVETATMLMLATFLASRPSFDHYLMVVVPMLLASVAQPGGAARSVWFWVALLPQATGLTWPWLESGKRRAFKDASTVLVLAATSAVSAVRGRRVRATALEVPRPGGPGVASAAEAGGVRGGLGTVDAGAAAGSPVPAPGAAAPQAGGGPESVAVVAPEIAAGGVTEAF